MFVPSPMFQLLIFSSNKTNIELFEMNHTRYLFLMMDFKHNSRCPLKMINSCCFFTANVIPINCNFFKTLHRSLFWGSITEIKISSNQKVSTTSVKKSATVHRGPIWEIQSQNGLFNRTLRLMKGYLFQNRFHKAYSQVFILLNQKWMAWTFWNICSQWLGF